MDINRIIPQNCFFGRLVLSLRLRKLLKVVYNIMSIISIGATLGLVYGLYIVYSTRHPTIEELRDNATRSELWADRLWEHFTRE